VAKIFDAQNCGNAKLPKIADAEKIAKKIADTNKKIAKKIAEKNCGHPSI